LEYRGEERREEKFYALTLT